MPFFLPELELLISKLLIEFKHPHQIEEKELVRWKVQCSLLSIKKYPRKWKTGRCVLDLLRVFLLGALGIACLLATASRQNTVAGACGGARRSPSDSQVKEHWGKIQPLRLCSRGLTASSEIPSAKFRWSQSSQNTITSSPCSKQFWDTISVTNSPGPLW